MVTVRPLFAESETLNTRLFVPALPSEMVAAAMLKLGGASSSLMDPTPVPSWMSADAATFDSATLKVSGSASSATSPLTVIAIGLVSSPGANVTVPAAAR